MTEQPKVRIGPLVTVGGILTEMARVYREARRGSLDDLKASRLVGMLREMRQSHEVILLEERLAALEARLAAKH